MATCKDCLHYDICIFHLKGNENEQCKQFLNTADVVPRSTITEIFAELDDFVNLLCTDNDDRLIYSEIRKKYMEGEKVI